MKQELLNKLNTKIVGKNILYYETIDSTQLRAKEIKEIVKNGTIIIANKQTAGIGTHERTWYMGEDENIAFTIILKPNCNIAKIENLTILIAKCMVNTINKLYGKMLDIKLPNDLMCNGKKIGGILTRKYYKWRRCKRYINRDWNEYKSRSVSRRIKRYCNFFKKRI